MGKKGQEEMMGFALIVVVVTIMILIFLGLFLRQSTSDNLESVEVKQFLESIMEYTSECVISYKPDYSSLGDLIDDCDQGKICLSGDSSCKVLNNTLDSLLNSSWPLGENSRYKGYRLNILFEIDEIGREIISIEEGQCSGRIRGAENVRASYPGNIVTTLNVCI
jgi:hypothetical protein